MSGTVPFTGITDGAVIFKVISGARPPRPISGWCPDVIWELVEKCWSQDPAQRPRAVQVERELRSVTLNEARKRSIAAASDEIKPFQAGSREIEPDSSMEMTLDVTGATSMTVNPPPAVTVPLVQKRATQKNTSCTTAGGDRGGNRTKDGKAILFYVKTLYDYKATNKREISFRAGDIIAVTATSANGWWSGELLDEGRRQPGKNAFPSNFVGLSDERLIVRARYDNNKPCCQPGDIIVVDSALENGWWRGELPDEARTQPRGGQVSRRFHQVAGTCVVGADSVSRTWLGGRLARWMRTD